MNFRTNFICILFFLFASLNTLPSLAEVKKTFSEEIPFRVDSGLTKAEYLISVGQYSSAISTALNVLSRHPQNPDAYTYRGYAYYKLGETNLAAKDFKKALTLNPQHLGANKYLATIFLENGEIARAIEQLQVIRMTCGHTDCEEMRVLEREIDKHKYGKN